MSAMTQLYLLLQKTTSVINKLKQKVLNVFIYLVNLYKTRPYLALFLICLYFIVSFAIMIVLYLIGGWTLLSAYLVCKLTGACPI